MQTTTNGIATLATPSERPLDGWGPAVAAVKDRTRKTEVAKVLHEEGETQQAIADRLGITRFQVRLLLDSAGVPRQARTTSTTAELRQFVADVDALVLRGFELRELDQWVGMSRHAVERAYVTAKDRIAVGGKNGVASTTRVAVAAFLAECMKEEETEAVTAVGDVSEAELEPVATTTNGLSGEIAAVEAPLHRLATVVQTVTKHTEESLAELGRLFGEDDTGCPSFARGSLLVVVSNLEDVLQRLTS